MYLSVRPAPERRQPVRLGLGGVRVEVVDRKGRERSWPRSAVARLRLVCAGVTAADRTGFRVPLATALALDGPGGVELIRVPWWGNWHESLEQAAALTGLPLVYAEGRGDLVLAESTQHPRWRQPSPVALTLGASQVMVVDRSGRHGRWPRLGYLPPWIPPGALPSTPPPPGTVLPVARLRLYRDYSTETWLKAVSLVDPWRRELVLIRWDSLRGAAAMRAAASAAGLLPEFCWESGEPERLTGHATLVV